VGRAALPLLCLDGRQASRAHNPTAAASWSADRRASASVALAPPPPPRPSAAAAPDAAAALAAYQPATRRASVVVVGVGVANAAGGGLKGAEAGRADVPVFMLSRRVTVAVAPAGRVACVRG